MTVIVQPTVSFTGFSVVILSPAVVADWMNGGANMVALCQEDGKGTGCWCFLPIRVASSIHSV